MIQFTQGDVVTLQLTATDGNGNPVSLVGASFSTLIRGPNGNTIVFGNSQHTANPDQVGSIGQYTLALAAADTSACASGINKEVITIVTQGASQVYYRGKSILTVLTPVPAA